MLQQIKTMQQPLIIEKFYDEEMEVKLAVMNDTTKMEDPVRPSALSLEK